MEIKNEQEVGEIMSEGNDVRVDIESMLMKVRDTYDASNHKIAMVPSFLRGGNEEAYDPKVVPIGPIHHNKKHYSKFIKDHKLWYLDQVLERRKHSLHEFMTAIEYLEDKARKYYSSLIDLPGKEEFVLMLLLDGVFVIELARKWRFSVLVNKKDYIFQYGKIHSTDDKDRCNEELIQIRRDMLLIENQLPFFILEKVFEMTKTELKGDDLHLLVLDFFRRIIPGRPELVRREKYYGDNHDHLLGLVYEAYFVDGIIHSSYKKNLKYHEINSTSELHEKGIKFKRAEKTTLMNVKFENGVMRIPILEVGDVTESLFRNLIAYELIRFDDNKEDVKLGDDKKEDVKLADDKKEDVKLADDKKEDDKLADDMKNDKRKPRYVTEYCFLMQFLVNSKKDVEILRREGIVVNWMGDDEMVRLFFNKLTQNVATSQECYYANMIQIVNKYCDQRCNLKKWWTIFLRTYINTPWSISSVCAAVILLLITATNIVFTILSYRKKSKSG